MAFDTELARRIDHTLLRRDAADDDIVRLCDEGREFGFATVCVLPCFAALAATLLRGSGVGVSVVVSFPHGASTTEVKSYEAARAVRDGATEIDVVANLGWLAAGSMDRAREEIAAVVAAARPAPVKVIIETGLLSDRHKREAAAMVRAAGASFVKTSTGFGPGGATVEDVRLLRQAVGPGFGVKASGGIRARAEAMALLAAGADRLGCSASVAIVTAA